jgi:uncharacterized OB-fold protein
VGQLLWGATQTRICEQSPLKQTKSQEAKERKFMTQEQETAKSPPMTKPLSGIPLPDLDLVPDFERGFWEGTKAHELRLQQCSDCQRFRHLPTPMCPSCHSLKYEWTKVSGRGKVYAHMIVRQPNHPGLQDQVPYNISLIELKEQDGDLRILSNVLNVAPEDIVIDMPVRVAFMAAADDPNVVLPLFVPAEDL